MAEPEKQLLNIGELHQHSFEEPPQSFTSFMYELCVDMTIGQYARILGYEKVCIPCGDAVVKKG